MPPSREDLAALAVEPSTFLRHTDDALRRMAVTALDEATALERFSDLADLSRDPNDAVRAAAAERLGLCGSISMELLRALQSDPSAVVREAVATAYGETGDPAAIAYLVVAARDDDDRQVREAAVASLGAIGDTAAIEPLLSLIKQGPPQVRRRAIAAITVFDDPRVEPAIRAAALDRNPGVREAAEMVVGRQIAPSVGASDAHDS